MTHELNASILFYIIDLTVILSHFIDEKSKLRKVKWILSFTFFSLGQACRSRVEMGNFGTFNSVGLEHVAHLPSVLAVNFTIS